MPRCRVDPSLERTVIDGFSFPLGAYPIEPMVPRQGYVSDFEPADSDASEDGAGEGGIGGGGLGDEAAGGPRLEEWPDRYVFEIVITHERLESLVRNLLALFPGRVYPILDYLGHDAYREVDPYISYELMGMDRLLDTLRRFRGFFLEDGLVGFGAMVDDPFLYVFIDEHKIITIRCAPELKEKVERVLAAFDLEHLESAGVGKGNGAAGAKAAAAGGTAGGAAGGAAGAGVVGPAGGEKAPEEARAPAGPAGADAALHEHRSVLMTEDNRTDLLTEDEIVELLRDEWRLTLNVDPDSNTDEEGNELGLVPWHCQVRCAGEGEETCRYAEVLVGARSLREAEDYAFEAADELRPEQFEEWEDSTVVAADRLSPEMVKELYKARSLGEPPKAIVEGIIWRGWPE